MRVDFPAPLSPTTPSTSPFVIFKLTSLRAVIVPKNLDIDFASKTISSLILICSHKENFN